MNTTADEFDDFTREELLQCVRECHHWYGYGSTNGDICDNLWMLINGDDSKVTQFVLSVFLSRQSGLQMKEVSQAVKNFCERLR